jgi:hypothetical protein
MTTAENPCVGTDDEVSSVFRGCEARAIFLAHNAGGIVCTRQTTSARLIAAGMGGTGRKEVPQALGDQSGAHLRLKQGIQAGGIARREGAGSGGQITSNSESLGGA